MTENQTKKSVLNYYLYAWKKWNDFKGRTSRAAFWWFFLINVIVGAVLNLVPFLSDLYAIAVFIPMTAITARRLHDVNKSAWWMAPVIFTYGLCVLAILGFMLQSAALIMFWALAMYAFVPGVVFSVILLVFCVRAGTEDENKYGQIE